jgi:hypothetical protein
MRALMGLIKDRHGTYCAQQRVPPRLQAAVAQVLGNGKARQVYLKKSLGTKDLKAANIRAKPVLAGFDRVFGEAEQLLTARPLRVSLSAIEIERMAEYVYAKALAWDERIRVGGRDELKRMEIELRKELKNEGRELEAPAYRYQDLPPHGLSIEQLNDDREQLKDDLRVMQEALALGNVSAVDDHTQEALSVFGINLDAGSLSRPQLGIAVLRAYVRALQALEKRNAGLPVETPLFTALECPKGAKGAAGVWLPLLALFSGARQAELAGLQVANVQHETDTPLLFIVADRKAGKTLKTKVSERVIPVHPQLVELGFLE